MTIFNKQSLLTELSDRIELVKAGTQPFLRLSDDQLNYKPARDKWSIAEIFEHLNISHGVYIRSIMAKITKAPEMYTEKYCSSWLGDWVYEKIMPRTDGSVFRLRSPKFLQPALTEGDSGDVLQRYDQRLDMILDILNHASTKDLERIKIPFPFTRMLKLRLGDTMRYLVAHSERHLLQAQRGIPVLPEASFDDYGAHMLQ